MQHYLVLFLKHAPWATHLVRAGTIVLATPALEGPSFFQRLAVFQTFSVFTNSEHNKSLSSVTKYSYFFYEKFIGKWREQISTFIIAIISKWLKIAIFVKFHCHVLSYWFLKVVIYVAVINLERACVTEELSVIHVKVLANGLL